MSQAREPAPPAFFWQGLLIVLPVILLAGIGLLSLQNDRQLARTEATQRAQAAADELLSKLQALLVPQDASILDSRAFQVDGQGDLLQPPPVLDTPEPLALDPGRLEPAQAELWRQAQAQAAEAPEPDPAKAAAAWTAFLDSKPPPPFQAVARYGLALARIAQDQLQPAADLLAALLQDHPEARGESGLPLAPFAELKLLDLQARSVSPGTGNRPVSLESFCSNTVANPTPIAPLLLDLAEARARTPADRESCARWRRVSALRQATRDIHRAARGQLGSGRRFFWATTPRVLQVELANSRISLEPIRLETREWLLAAAGEQPGKTNRTFFCHTEAELGAALSSLADRPGLLPEYCAVSLSAGGRRISRFAPDAHEWKEMPYFTKSGGGFKKEVSEAWAADLLAAAPATRADEGLPQVAVYLANPGLLYKAQRARTVWFGVLIAAAAAAALAGFLAAWRAFRRQLQLGELKSNFVSSVSHELRAPIASVRLMAESLERGKIEDEAKRREYFRFIGQECRRLSALVENVLDFSRIDRGRKRYEFEPVDLLALTRATAGLMEPYAAERGIALAFVTAESDCQVQADGKAIQQALVNLVDNAIKHSPAGETVRIGLDRVPAATTAAPDPVPGPRMGRIQLWVEDRGPGIPPEEHEKIFERFYRLGSELRRETTGVGIGLSIVKHIVEGHGGRVRLRSAPGQGSRFTIELPVDAAEPAEPEKATVNTAHQMTNTEQTPGPPRAI